MPDPRPTPPRRPLIYWWLRLRGASHTQAMWRAQSNQEAQYSARPEREVGEGAPVTLTLALACVGAYALQAQLGGGLLEPFPRGEDGVRLLFGLGAVLRASPEEGWHFSHEPWRLVSYVFLHGGLMHLLFNVTALFQIGGLIERTFGGARALAVWLSTGAAAIALPGLLRGYTETTVGASGAIFGLIGVAMVYGHRVGTAQGRQIRNKMVEWTVVCTLFGLGVGNVAHAAHFGGLAAGALLGLVLSPPRSPAAEMRSVVAALVSAAVIAWASYSVYGAALAAL